MHTAIERLLKQKFSKDKRAVFSLLAFAIIFLLGGGVALAETGVVRYYDNLKISNSGANTTAIVTNVSVESDRAMQNINVQYSFKTLDGTLHKDREVVALGGTSQDVSKGAKIAIIYSTSDPQVSYIVGTYSSKLECISLMIVGSIMIIIGGLVLFEIKRLKLL